MPRGVFPIFFSFVLGVVYEHLLSAGSRFIGLIIISITAMVRGEKKKTKPTTLRIFRKIGCDGRHVFLRSFFSPMAIEGGHVPLRIGKKRSSSTWPHHQGSCWGDVLCYQEEWPRPRQEHSPKTHAAARNRRWAAPRSRIPIVNWRRRTQSTFSSSRGLLLFSLLFVGQAAPLLPSLSLVPKTPKGERERGGQKEKLSTQVRAL